MIKVIGGFAVGSWVALALLIVGLNNLFVTDRSKNRTADILERGIGLNPFNRLFFNKAPKEIFRISGFLAMLVGLFIIGATLERKPDVLSKNTVLIPFLLANIVTQFWVLYFMRRLKMAFEDGRLKPGLLYEEVATLLGAIPRVSFNMVFISLLIVHCIFFLRCFAIL